MNTQSHGRPLDANYWRQGCLIASRRLPSQLVKAGAC
jgi:hypothetical protein